MTNSKYKFDRLRLFFGEDYIIDSNNLQATIMQPTIGQILYAGEKNFYSMLYTFIGNPTMFRLQLWDIGIDWNKITDYELFCMMIKNLPFELTSIIFGDLDFSSFELYPIKNAGDDQNCEITLYSLKHNYEISEDAFMHIRDYLRTMFNFYPKTEKAKGKTTKEWMIEEEREKQQNLSNNQSYVSNLLPLVSFCVNHPGFKYRTDELKNIGIYQFMDSVQRLNIYENTSALNTGLYSGMRDLSKVDKKLFDFMRDINN